MQPQMVVGTRCSRLETTGEALPTNMRNTETVRTYENTKQARNMYFRSDSVIRHGTTNPGVPGVYGGLAAHTSLGIKSGIILVPYYYLTF